MTNLDRIKGMNVDEYIEEFFSLKLFPFFNYFDMEAYLKSEDPDKLNFLKAKGECTVTPSEVEVLCHVPKGSSEAERENYINSHLKKYKLLDKTKMFDSDYIVVADVENMQITKIPEKYVVSLKEY